jgi:hypothetical protein
MRGNCTAAIALRGGPPRRLLWQLNRLRFHGLNARRQLKRSFSSAVVLSAVLIASGCASSARVVAPTSLAEVGEFRHGFLNGYLAPADLPDSLALLPAPPVAGSAAQAAADAAFRELVKFQRTPRAAIAVQDADLSFPRAAQFSHARSAFRYLKRKRRT